MRFAREEKKGRFIALIAIFSSIFLIFALTLVKIQLVDGAEYAKSSTAYFASTEVKATRGQILDRNGKVLVGNRQGNDVIFSAVDFPSHRRQEERNVIIKSLIDLFQKNKIEWVDELPITLDSKGNYIFKKDSERAIEKLKSRDMLHLNKYATADDCMAEIIDRFSLENYSKSDAMKIGSVCCNMRLSVFNSAKPYVFAQDVSDEIVSVIKENSSFYKGVDVQIATYREYTDGSIAPHIIGVTGIINAEEYAELKDKGYAMDDILGKSGIEQIFEEQLKGKNGTKTVTTSIEGKQQVSVEGLKNGNNIQLTIDADLQKITQDSLKKFCDSRETANAGAGAAVVTDCRTGEVLALASYPTFDLSTYYDDYEKLVKDPLAPLYNRATLSVYAPGSTAKVSTAIACLEEGVADEHSTKYCAYYYPYKGHNFVCMNDHANRNITVRTALQDSCNSYFYYYGGEKLGADKMNMYREMLGLGQSTGIELPESLGVLDSPAYRTSIGQAWFPGFALQSAIGQAGNLFTPVQLCNYVATVANGGTRYDMHLVKSILSPNNKSVIEKIEPKIACETGFSKKNLDIVKQGMRLVVTNSYCRYNFGKLDIAVACKTGTSQVDKTINGVTKTYNNGFNISFAPYDAPEVAVAVAVEGATSGSSVAEVGCDIYNFYFKDKDTTKEEEIPGDAEEESDSDDKLLR